MKRRIVITVAVVIGIAALGVGGWVLMASFAKARNTSSMAPDYWQTYWRTQRVLFRIRQFHADCGVAPSAEQGLSALVADPGIPGWNGPYLSRIPNDAWGRPLTYAVTQCWNEVAGETQLWVEVISSRNSRGGCELKKQTPNQGANATR